MVQFLMGFRSTTKTIILVTMISITLSYSAPVIIKKYILNDISALRLVNG